METIEELEFFLEKRTANFRTLQAMERRQAWMAFVGKLEIGWYESWRRVLTGAPLREKPVKPKPKPKPPEPEPPSLDSDVQEIIDRVEADGGEVTDEIFLNDFIVDLKTANVYTLFDVLYIPIAVKKDEGNRVSKVYDLSPSKAGGIYYDVVQPDPAKQQLFQANQIDGKPWIMFDGARLGYLSAVTALTVPMPYTFFAIAACSQSTSSVWRTLIGVGLDPNRAVLTYDSSVPRMAICTSNAIYTPSMDVTVIRQFTGQMLPPALSLIRCKGAASGSPGGLSDITIPNGNYLFGQMEFAGSIHIGPIAFAAACRQAITTQQRDGIENLLNIKYYPSTIA